jgi:hypothetical protein
MNKNIEIIDSYCNNIENIIEEYKESLVTIITETHYIIENK